MLSKIETIWNSPLGNNCSQLRMRLGFSKNIRSMPQTHTNLKAEPKVVLLKHIFLVLPFLLIPIHFSACLPISDSCHWLTVTSELFSMNHKTFTPKPHIAIRVENHAKLAPKAISPTWKPQLVYCAYCRKSASWERLQNGCPVGQSSSVVMLSSLSIRLHCVVTDAAQ